LRSKPLAADFALLSNSQLKRQLDPKIERQNPICVSRRGLQQGVISTTRQSNKGVNPGR
jgi:hypothetical protein